MLSVVSSPTAALTADQTRLRDWIRSYSASLAELYEGAVIMRANRAPPGYTRLICHALREIANRLPQKIAGPQGDRVDYTGHVDKIAAGWREVAPALGPAPSIEEPSARASLPETVPIPRRVARDIGQLVDEHTKRDRRDRTAAAMFLTVAGTPSSSEQLVRSSVDTWTTSGEWFLRAHDSGESTDAAFDWPTLTTHFSTIEQLMLTMATPITEQLGGLDAILAEANR